jgi:hypothetical protein
MFILLLRPDGATRGTVYHLEGKSGERAMAILRFLCGSPRLCRLRTMLFWPRWQVWFVLTACRVLWGPINLVAFITTLSSHTSLGAKTSSREQGLRFDLVGTCKWLSYVRPRGSRIWRVGQVLPLYGVHWFESPRHFWIWVTVCRCCHLLVCFDVLMAWIRCWLCLSWWLLYLLYLWRWHGLMFYLFMHVIVCRCKQNIWLNKNG